MGLSGRCGSSDADAQDEHPDAGSPVVRHDSVVQRRFELRLGNHRRGRRNVLGRTLRDLGRRQRHDRSRPDQKRHTNVAFGDDHRPVALAPRRQGRTDRHAGRGGRRRLHHHPRPQGARRRGRLHGARRGEDARHRRIERRGQQLLRALHRPAGESRTRHGHHAPARRHPLLQHRRRTRSRPERGRRQPQRPERRHGAETRFRRPGQTHRNVAGDPRRHDHHVRAVDVGRIRIDVRGRLFAGVRRRGALARRHEGNGRADDADPRQRPFRADRRPDGFVRHQRRAHRQRHAERHCRPARPHGRHPPLHRERPQADGHPLRRVDRYQAALRILVLRLVAGQQGLQVHHHQGRYVRQAGHRLQGRR